MKDLHLHLSGATSPILLFEMISETGIKIKAKQYEQFVNTLLMDDAKVKNLDDYLDIIHTIDETQSSPRAVELSFYDSYKNSFLSGCKYLELRWNPYKRSQNFKIDLDKLDYDDFRAWLSYRSMAGLSNRTNSRALSSIKSFFKFLEKKYSIFNEIVFKIKGPKFNKSLPRNISDNNLYKMLQCIKDFNNEQLSKQSTLIEYGLLFITFSNI